MLNVVGITETEFKNEIFNFLPDHINGVMDIDSHSFEAERLNRTECQSYYSRRPLNDLENISKFFEKANRNLCTGDYLVYSLETFTGRSNRLGYTKIRILGKIASLVDYLFFRVLPKLRLTRPVYNFFFGTKSKSMSKTEGLGRAIKAGFELVEYKSINNRLYVLTRKQRSVTNISDVRYGPLIKLPRTGKRGKTIMVYKLRTMHPYAEYLQTYLVSLNGSNNGDKINSDFRVSKLGSIFRKFWLDEIPMIYNVFKGELKLVGVRPLSKAKLDLYPDDMIQLRLMYKPGLVPPFYADLPDSLHALIESERKYLERYSKAPIRTDCIYLLKSLRNIFIKGARSA